MHSLGGKCLLDIHRGNAEHAGAHLSLTFRKGSRLQIQMQVVFKATGRDAPNRCIWTGCTKQVHMDRKKELRTESWGHSKVQSSGS